MQNVKMATEDIFRIFEWYNIVDDKVGTCQMDRDAIIVLYNSLTNEVKTLVHERYFKEISDAYALSNYRM